MRAGSGGAYLVADAARIPAADASYDIVLLFDLLEHVPDVGRCVAEIARILKPGGLFHGFVPLEAQPKTLFRALTHSRRIPIHQMEARSRRPYPAADDRERHADLPRARHGADRPLVLVPSDRPGA